MISVAISFLLLAAPRTTLGIGVKVMKHRADADASTQPSSFDASMMPYSSYDSDLGLVNMRTLVSLEAPHGAHPASDKMRPDMAEGIVGFINGFISASGGKQASLIIHGDSTQSGLSARINEALGPKEDIYSSYSCVNWGENCTAVSNATLPSSQTALSSKHGDVINNLNSAFRVLQECNGGYTGGAIWATSHLDGRLIKYMWSFSPENRFGSCWNSCMTNAIKALKPHAVVVNQGLHLLHLHPGRPCDTGSFYNCGNYQAHVENILTSLREVSPITIWRMTNWICDTKYNQGWKDALSDWKNSSKLTSMESQCRKQCKGFSDANPCKQFLLDSGGAWNQYTSATRAIEAAKAEGRGQIGSVDAFDVTYANCKLTVDARHYKGLDAVIALRMAQELERLAKLAPRQVE